MVMRIIAIATLIAFVNCLFGCTTTRTMFPDEIGGTDKRITAVVLKSGETISFGGDGGTYQWPTDTISGVTGDSTAVQISLNDIRHIKIKGQGPRKHSEYKIDVKAFRAMQERRSNEKIVAIVMPTGNEIIFNDIGGRIERTTQTIRGYTDYNQPVDVKINDVLYIKVKRADPVKSIAATIGVLALGVAVLAVIVAMTKESCPFIYSYDGNEYVFDAEPLGGAICPGMQRSDYSRLEHIKPVDGEYRLLVRNEVEETQYLDEAELLIVDHPAGFDVMADSTGNMYYVKNQVVPVSAVDENGRDIMKFVSKKDSISWQSHMPVDTILRQVSPKHELTFTFPKPHDAAGAKLITNVGTSLWGSDMIREMLQMGGPYIDIWYDAINRHGPEKTAMHDFAAREALWLLDINILEDSGWVSHGFIPGQGPLIVEDRVLPLDISNVRGDSITIRLTPAFGFWTIDYLAMEYENYAAPEVAEIPLKKASDSSGNGITELLSVRDSTYFILSEVGDWSTMAFSVPEQSKGTERAVFLKTSGYYQIHLPKDQLAQMELLSRIGSTPGEAVKFAVDRFLEWSQALTASTPEK